MSENREFVPAIYNGKPVENLWVSEDGWMRRKKRNGEWKEPTRGTPNINKKYNNYLRSYEVLIKDPEYKRPYRAVNLHRVIYETFTGNPWVDGCQLDHIDRTKRCSLDNLRCVTPHENMLNQNPRRPIEAKKGTKFSNFRYTQLLRFGVNRLVDLPDEVQKEYWRIRWREISATRKQKALVS